MSTKLQFTPRFVPDLELLFLVLFIYERSVLSIHDAPTIYILFAVRLIQVDPESMVCPRWRSILTSIQS